MQTITLKNSLTHNVQWCGVSSGILYAEIIDNDDMKTIFDEFSDTEATAEITYQFGFSETYTGYTDLVGIQKDIASGHITVTLAHRG